MENKVIYKSEYKNAPQSALKLRLVANIIRGKNAQWALDQLELLNKKGARLVKKALKSAVANAKSLDGIEANDLVVDKIMVNEAKGFKKVYFSARGRASRLNRRRSHIYIELTKK